MKFTNFPEIISAGIFDSKVALPDIVESKQRWVSMYEIELPIEVQGSSFINNTEYKLCSNNILFAKPGQVRHSRLHFKTYYLHIIADDDKLREMLNSVPDIIEIDDNEEYVKIFKDIITAFSLQTEQNALLLQSKLLELLYKLTLNSVPFYRSHFKSDREIVIKKAISYMDKHYSENISLSDVADYVHLSKIYFHNMFKSASGLTPYKYIINRRIDEAKKYLIFPEISMTEISELCGFTSQSYFNYVFKHETGFTPGQFQKIHNRQID